jgi:polysaccharide biosynthesis protein PslH
MRIAYIVPYVPNLIRTRPHNFITQLTSLGHEVAVFTLGSNKQEWMDAQTLKGKCSEMHYHSQPVWRSLLTSAAAIPSSKPLQSVYSWQRGMAVQVSQRVFRQEFDIVHVEHLRGSRYGVFLKSRFPTMPIVWDSVDCISHLFRQAASQSRSFFGKVVTRFELPRTEHTEGNLVCMFDHVLVTSSADREALLELAPSGKLPSPVSVLPNGVDLDYFQPKPEFQRDSETIVFSGKMSYHANITMVRYLVTEIMPRIWRVRPAAHLCIAGKDPPSEIKDLEKNPLIRVTGTVDDIRPFLWRATVSVVPLLYGVGIQNKILEAMAAGTPVVTTCRALPALQVQPGKDLLASNDPDEFAQAVLRVIEDRNLQRRMRAAGVNYVRTFHNWTQIASQLLNIYQQTLNVDGNPG